jgi:hypothetical protein
MHDLSNMNNMNDVNHMNSPRRLQELNFENLIADVDLTIMEGKGERG